MKKYMKYIKIGIISLCSILVILFTASFFMLDFLFLFNTNKEGNISNFEVDGLVRLGNTTTEIDADVDGNKIKAEIGPVEFYVQSNGTTKYIYTKSIFGGWIKTALKTSDDQTKFVDLIKDIERDDFSFKSIGYYEMKQEKLDEYNLKSMSIRFKGEGIFLTFVYDDNISYSLLLSDFGKAKVNLPS